LFLALGALGVPTEARPRLFQRAMGIIFDMVDGVRAVPRGGAEASLGADAQDDSRLVADGVSAPRLAQHVDVGLGNRVRIERAIWAVGRIEAVSRAYRAVDDEWATWMPFGPSSCSSTRVTSWPRGMKQRRTHVAVESRNTGG
jgi:hypothetical protein